MKANKILLSFSIILLATTSLSAQTKKIAFRSHSGKDAAYSMDEDGDYGLSLSRIDSTKHSQTEKEQKEKLRHKDSSNHAAPQKDTSAPNSTQRKGNVSKKKKN